MRQRLVDLDAEEGRHQALDDIARDVGQHRHDERRLEADVHDEHHGDQAADIRQRDADDDVDERIALEVRRSALQCTDDRIDDEPGNDVAARRPEELAEAGRAADKYRQADAPEQYIDEQRHERLFWRQHESRHAERQRQRRDHAGRKRQRKRNIRRHAAERHAERYLGHIPCCD